MPGDHEPGYARWLVEREHGRPPASDRVRNDGRRGEFELVEDVSDERVRVSRKIDTVVIERIGKTMSRAVDCEHAMTSSEERHEGRPLIRSISSAMHEENRRPIPEFEQLGLPLRPRESTDLRLGCEPSEKTSLRVLNLSIELVARHGASLRVLHAGSRAQRHPRTLGHQNVKRSDARVPKVVGGLGSGG